MWSRKERNPPRPRNKSEEQKQLTSDLHWLIHQGHVLEFSNGIIETAKKPKKKPEPSAEPKATDTSPDESLSGSQPAETESVESADKDTSEESVSAE